jgi:hypothetical protein
MSQHSTIRIKRRIQTEYTGIIAPNIRAPSTRASEVGDAGEQQVDPLKRTR